MAEFGIAVNKRKKVGEEWKDIPTFIDITAWERTAEVVGQYAAKGAKVGIEGELTLDIWDDKQTGQRRQKLKVTAHRVHLLASRGPEDQRPIREDHGEESQVPATNSEPDDTPF